MRKKLNEITKIVSKTQPNGEVNFEPMDSDVASRLNGTEIIDADGDRIKIKDTGKTISEAEEPIKLNLQDLLNTGKTLNTVVEDTLRKHGDTIAYTKPKTNKDKTAVIIYVYYEKDVDNPGKPSEDRFSFIFEDNKVKLLDAGDKYDICTISKQSGTVYINRDLAEDKLMQFIRNNDSLSDRTEGTSTEEDYPNGQGFENKDMEAQDSYKTDDETLSEELLLGFRKAADAYKNNPKNKEAIKELFRQARNFTGDTIQDKLRNAIQIYKGTEPIDVTPVEAKVRDEEPCISCQDDRECDCSICLDMSLLIRLFEFAHEEAKDDVALHFVAENLEKVCKEKGCACMSDYETLISQSETKPEEEQDMDESITDDWDAEEKQRQYEEDREAEAKWLADVDESSVRSRAWSNKYYKGPKQDTLTEPEELPSQKNIDVLQRAHNLDQIASQDFKEEVMQELSTICDAAESLDDTVENYIKNTIPNITVEQFKQAVDNVLARA